MWQENEQTSHLVGGGHRRSWKSTAPEASALLFLRHKTWSLMCLWLTGCAKLKGVVTFRRLANSLIKKNFGLNPSISTPQLIPNNGYGYRSWDRIALSFVLSEHKEKRCEQNICMDILIFINNNDLSGLVANIVGGCRGTGFNQTN